MTESKRSLAKGRPGAGGDQAGRCNLACAPGGYRVLSRLFAVGCAVILVGAVLTGTGIRAAQNGVAGREANLAPPAALTLAVVDLDRVFEQSTEWRDYEQQRGQLMDTIRRSLSHYDRQVRVLQNEYADLPPGTAEATQKQRELEAVVDESRAAQEEFNQQLGAQHSRSLSTMLDKISTLLEAYAKANDIDLVLKKQNLRVSPAMQAEMGIIVAMTDVLYVSERFDVTEPIVKQLNAELEQGLILSP